jgi:ectoine hydroxylase-related dioxygenase (phytanoyl-CoA dioxygenase family)
MKILGAEQIQCYRERGYLVPPYRLPEPVLVEMRNAFDRLLARNPDLRSDVMLQPHMEIPGAQGVKGSKEWVKFAKIPEILDIVGQLIGEDLILWGMTVFGKPAKIGKATPWHQDGDIYPVHPLETVTVWIAIDDATPQNGCMQYIPGSHRQRKLFSRHVEENENLTVNIACDAEHFDESTAENLELEAGQISLHDIYMIHRSTANTSGRRRAAVVMRIMPGTCYFDHRGPYGEEVGGGHVHEYTRRPLYLLRGQDRTGRNNFEIGHS